MTKFLYLAIEKFTGNHIYAISINHLILISLFTLSSYKMATCNSAIQRLISIRHPEQNFNRKLNNKNK